jgi:hypothetical protein
MPYGIASAARLEEKSWRTRRNSFKRSAGRGRNWTRDMSVRRTTCSINGHLCRNVSRKMETMGSSRINTKKPMTVDKQGLTPESSAVEENVQAIKGWERAILHALESRTSQRMDCVYRGKRTGVGPSRPVVRRVDDRKHRSRRRHSPIRSVPLSVPHDDRFPGSHLPGALRVGEPGPLVAASRQTQPPRLANRLARRAIAGHLRVETSVTPEQLRDLMKRTDLKRLTNRMEELAKPADASASTKSDAEAESPRVAAS